MFFLYLFIALQVSAIVVALVARAWRIEPEPVVWRGIDVPNASAQVCLFIESVYDHQFAYPTGFFRIEDEAALDRGDVSMREANFKGSHGFSYIPRVFIWAHEVMRQARYRASRGGTSPAELFALFLMGWIVYGFAGVLAGLFAGVSLLDMGYRALYRSHIHAQVTPHASLDDAVEIKLRFQGLSAYGAIQDVLGGMATPTLPAAAGTAITAAAPADAPAAELESTRVQRMQSLASAAHLRFRVLYGTGVASALLLATLLAVVINPAGGTSDSYAAGAGDAQSSYSASSSDETATESDSSDTSDTSDTDSSEPADDDATLEEDESDSAGDASLLDSAFEGDGYALSPPGGWIRDHADRDEGSYYESRWHMRGNPAAFVLVNYTPGFDGSAHSGAASVRSLLKDGDGYEEHDWRARGDAWRWEFSHPKDRRIDEFSTDCDTGWAVLAAAPNDEFEDLRETYDAVIDSLTPDC